MPSRPSRWLIRRPTSPAVVPRGLRPMPRSSSPAPGAGEYRCRTNRMGWPSEPPIRANSCCIARRPWAASLECVSGVASGEPWRFRTPLHRVKSSAPAPAVWFQASRSAVVDPAGVEPATYRLSGDCTEPLCFGSELVGWGRVELLPDRARFYRPLARAASFPNPSWSRTWESNPDHRLTKAEHRATMLVRRMAGSPEHDSDTQRVRSA